MHHVWGRVFELRDRLRLSCELPLRRVWAHVSGLNSLGTVSLRMLDFQALRFVV